MNAVFRMCRGNQWESVFNSIRSNRLIATTAMTMANNISTTILHQAITSKGDIKKRAKVIQDILRFSPEAARMKNGYGSLPLHVISQRNLKMKSKIKVELIRNLIDAYPESVTQPGGVGLRTPLHIIFTDYVSKEITKTMIDYGNQACFMRDKNGYLPIHVACSRHCSPAKLEMLLEVNPASLLATTDDGKTILYLAETTATVQHPNYTLIAEIEKRIELASPPNIPPTATAKTDRDQDPDSWKNQGFAGLDSNTESAFYNVAPVRPKRKPKGKRKAGTKLNKGARKKIKQEDAPPAMGPLVKQDGISTKQEDAPPAMGPLVKQDDISTKQEDESTKQDEPANLLLHFSRHTEV